MPERVGSCPYAVAVSDDEAPVEEVMELAKKSCPAFAQAGSCPFKDAKTSKDVKHTLLQVPPSHLEASGHFQKALKHLHDVNQNLEGDEKYRLDGCPMQTYYPEQQDAIPFVQAMEEWSLAAIMARMASDVEDEDSEQGDTESVSAITATPSVILNKSPAVVPDTPKGLAEALKTGTAASHQAAEDVHFVRNFIRGKIDRTLYAQLVLSLFFVYEALEEELDLYAPQHFAACHFPKELARKETLQEDVDFWLGNANNKRMSRATQDYVDRLHFIAQTDPLLLLSHAYTRYLGDLSGGKILARVARRAMNLDKNGDGLRFYEFEHVESAKKFKDEYRRALDQLSLSRAQISKLVAEANVAFVLNMRIFEELDVMATIPGARVRDLDEALAFAYGNVDANDDASDKCPFATINSKGETVYQVGPSENTKGRCPWPFVFMHDAKTGMQDWQTWLVLGLMGCWIWSKLQSGSFIMS